MDITKMQVAGWECRYYGLEHSELERRRDAVKAVMREKDVSVLLLNDMVRGGYFQWLLGAGVSERPTEEILILPLEGEMTICLTSECFSEEQQKNYQKPDATNSQDARFGDAVNVPAFYYEYLSKHLTEENRKVGILYPDSIRRTVKKYLEEQIPGIELIDLTEEMEYQKAMKSDAERKILKDAAEFHDNLFSAVPAVTHPGMTEADLVKELRYRAYQMGCGGEDVMRTAVTHLTTCRDDEKEYHAEVEYPGRVLQEGDRINLKMQCVTYDEFFGALGRCFVLGEASAETRRDWELLLDVQNHMAELTVPGKTVREIAEETRQYREKLGLPEDRSNFIYGIGVMAGEAPNRAVYPDMLLCDGMTMVLAPQLQRDGTEAMYCADMFVIENGHAKRLNRFPAEIQEIYIGAE